MNIKELNGLSEYISQPIWDMPTMIFRGISKSSYPLKTSVGRLEAKNNSDHQRFETSILEDFKRKSYPYLDHYPQNDFEWIFLAQHYGIPTRLLDWTTNPLVALYFASEKSFDDDFAVYKTVIDNEYYNFDKSSSPFKIEEIGLLQPLYNDIRYVNQRGVFTIHPNPTEPMDTSNMTKYSFKAAQKEEIHHRLRIMGISKTFIYPGLESLAQDIVQEHLPKLNGGKIRTFGNFLDW